ncbi:MAG: HEAT repeat domain-containing protein [Candidatus Micrarchaeia archaeon]
MLSKQKTEAGAPRPAPVRDFFRRLRDAMQERVMRARLAWEMYIIATRHGRRVDRIMSAFKFLGAHGDESTVNFLIEVARETTRFKLDAFHALAKIGGEAALTFLIEQLNDEESSFAAREALEYYKRLHPSPETDRRIDAAIASVSKPSSPRRMRT